MNMGSIEHQLRLEDEQLCWIRIQNTRSRTLISFVDAQFHEDRIWTPSPAHPVLTTASPLELAQYDLFRGPFGYDIYRVLPRRPVYITLLRNPIQRVVSLYNLYKNRAGHRQDHEISQIAASSSLDEFVRCTIPHIRVRTSNGQAHQIVSGVWENSFDEVLALPDSDLLALASDRLSQFSFVGLTERLSESMVLLAYIFGWYPNFGHQSYHLSRGKFSSKFDSTSGDQSEVTSLTASGDSEIRQDWIDVITEHNQVDLQLYEYVRHQFTSQMAHILKDLTKYEPLPFDATRHSSIDPSPNPALFAEIEADQFQTVIKQLEQHYQKQVAVLDLPAVGHINFDMAQPLSGSGWHPRQTLDQTSRLRLPGKPTTFRWTGPGTVSTINLPLSVERDLKIKIHWIRAIAPDVLDSLTLKILDKTIPLERGSEDESPTVVQGTIPATLFNCSKFNHSKSNLIQLSLIVNRTGLPQPSDLGAPKDHPVGIAIERIQVFPAATALPSEDYGFYPFPGHDPSWVEAAEFLRRHLQPGETIAGPGEFYHPFPEQFCSYASPFYAKPELTWVVLHKGLLDETHFSSMKWAMRKLYPVFVNPIFAILTRRRNVSRLKSTSQDWLAFQLNVWLLDLERRKLLSESQKMRLVNLAKSGYRLARTVLRK
jgi:hypothetical protein